LARRCVTDGRPAVVLYFSDFDPSGWQMAISVARKLQALRTLRFPDLDLELYPVAMSYEQVSRLNLPSTPLKDTEKRADRWREKWNHEQTEIDALAALNPAELRRIAIDAVTPFFDETLADRTDDFRRNAEDIAAATLAAHPQYGTLRQRIAEARDRLIIAAAGLELVQQQAFVALSDVELPDQNEPPEPELMTEPPEPLFSTADDYATATLRLKAHKELYSEDED
jgi:hypothetical protein